MDTDHFVWDVFQQYQIHKLNKTFDAAKDVVAQDQAGMQTTVGQVEEKLESLALICRALFELLEEKTGLTEQELAKKIAEVDLRDGQACASKEIAKLADLPVAISGAK